MAVGDSGDLKKIKCEGRAEVGGLAYPCSWEQECLWDTEVPVWQQRNSGTPKVMSQGIKHECPIINHSKVRA